MRIISTSIIRIIRLIRLIRISISWNRLLFSYAYMTIISISII